jgi:hypothetical protein
MALRITDQIETSAGSTTGLYFHVYEYFRDKDGSAKFPVSYFFDETKASGSVSLLWGDIKQRYDYTLTAQEIGSDSIEKIAYNNIAAELKAAGYVVESDETGSWVVV